MELWIGTDVARFATAAGAFLTAGPERNLMATVLEGVGSGRFSEATFAVVSDGAEVVGAAIRTPPRALLAAGEIAGAAEFVAAWLKADPQLPAVSAEPSLARALAGAWTTRTRGSAELDTSEALHLLGRVTPPQHPAPGHLRAADWRETAQLRDWGAAFAVDAGVPHPPAAADLIEHAINERRLYVWEHAGQPVAMVGHAQPVAGTARVGPVYTPSQLRGRGYATSATAAVSQLLLDRGAARCMLYTDLANPVSNHIYAQIGYVRFAESEVYRFIPAVR